MKTNTNIKLVNFGKNYFCNAALLKKELSRIVKDYGGTPMGLKALPPEDENPEPFQKPKEPTATGIYFVPVMNHDKIQRMYKRLNCLGALPEENEALDLKTGIKEGNKLVRFIIMKYNNRYALIKTMFEAKHKVQYENQYFQFIVTECAKMILSQAKPKTKVEGDAQTQDDGNS